MKVSVFITCCLLANLIEAQIPATPNKDAQKRIQQLANAKSVKNAFSIIDQLEPETLKDHILLTEIPAPPFKENTRALQYKKMLEQAGADKVWLDSLGNVIALRKGKKPTKTVALDAHLDTVFPEGTDVKVKMKGDTLYAPGIGDDSRGLAAILAVLKAMEKANIETLNDVLFIGSLGEEGLGDLRGVKYIFQKNEPKIDSWISVDGIDISGIVNGSLGSIRYKVTIKGPGGHSWGAFGLGNTHHALGKVIDSFAEEALKFTNTPGAKTSFNVGRIGGGTSVNAIPYESWMEVDMRSESPERLTQIDEVFKSSVNKALADYNQKIKKGEPLTLVLEQIGYRPSGIMDANHLLIQNAIAASAFFGAQPRLTTVSTNANVPVSKNIPAVTIGSGGKGHNAHALNEWYLNEKGAEGIKFTLLVLLTEAGLAK